MVLLFHILELLMLFEGLNNDFFKNFEKQDLINVLENEKIL